MKISRQGIEFEYHGDQLLWVWPWRRIKDQKYISHIFESDFKSLAEYWEWVGSWNEGCRKRKVVGYTEEDIFLDWAKKTFRFSTVIIMKNINVELKSTLFWRSLHVESRTQLLKDCPVLFFYDVKDADKVFNSIAPEFAQAFLFHKGELIKNNNETSTKSPSWENYVDPDTGYVYSKKA